MGPIPTAWNESGTVGNGAATGADRSVAIGDGWGHSIAVEDDSWTVLGWLGTVGISVKW